MSRDRTAVIARALLPARLALVAAGAGGIVWALATTPTWHGLVLEPATHFLLVVAVTAFALGLLLPTDLGRAAAWSALAVVGHATAFQLIDAGTLVRYQHWRPAVAPLAELDARLLAALAAQAGLVAVGLARERRVLAGWVRARLGWIRVLLLLAAVVALSASPFKDPAAYAAEIALAGTVGLVQLGTILLAGLALPDRPARRLEEWADRLLGPDEGSMDVPSARVRVSRLFRDRVAIGATLFTVVVAAALAWTIWERIPHIPDEVSYMFQARYFAAGYLVAPGVPVPEAFSAYLIPCTEEQCVAFGHTPGWPALLSLGFLAGAPWLINPILGGVEVLLAFALLALLYGRRLARGGAILLAASPWHLFLAMSFMTHVATGVAAMVAALGTALVWRRRQARWGVLTGVGVGLGSLIRPLDGLIVAAAVGAPLLCIGTWRTRLRAMAGFVTAAAAVSAIALPYNARITGDPLEFPLMAYLDQVWGDGRNDLGFGPDRGSVPMWEGIDAFPGHSPLEAVINAALNATAIQVELYGWALGSLTAALLLVLLGRIDRRDRWLLLGLLFMIALYSFYWFAGGPDLGGRYWSLSLVPLVALTARGIQELRRAAAPASAADGRYAGRVAWSVGLLLLISLGVFVPWRSTDKYHGYWLMQPTAREWVRDGSFGSDVVLIRGPSQPNYTAVMIYNPLDVRAGGPVFAWDSTPGVDRRLAEAFPDRRLWIVDGPDLAEGSYLVREVRPALHPAGIDRVERTP